MLLDSGFVAISTDCCCVVGGACCLHGSCSIVVDEAACLAIFGTYTGDGTVCADVDCTDAGCCSYFSLGQHCDNLFSVQCDTHPGSTFQGGGFCCGTILDPSANCCLFDDGFYGLQKCCLDRSGTISFCCPDSGTCCDTVCCLPGEPCCDDGFGSFYCCGAGQSCDGFGGCI